MANGAGGPGSEVSHDAVGVVGLGQMGGAIAARLIGAGFAVHGYDVDGRRVESFEREGGHRVRSPAALAGEVSVVLTSLPSDSALLDVIAGHDGVLAGAEEREIDVIETSTLSPAAKHRASELAADSRVRLLDCPLSGTAAQAAGGDVVVYASGTDAAVDRCRPVFAGFARAVFHLGAFGNGTTMKLVANHLVTIHNVAAAEALTLARKAGLDPQQAYEALAGGAGSSRMLEVRGPAMVDRTYHVPGAQVTTHLKDVGIIADIGRSLACPLPVFAASAQYYSAALAQGLADADTSAVCAVAERMAGLDTAVPSGEHESPATFMDSSTSAK